MGPLTNQTLYVLLISHRLHLGITAERAADRDIGSGTDSGGSSGINGIEAREDGGKQNGKLGARDRE
jgi:hypothetical protein